MRKTIIFATLAALFGLAAVAQASDQPRADTQDDSHVTRAVANHDRDGKHEREARYEHTRYHEAAEERHRAHETHDAHEAAEHRDRR